MGFYVNPPDESKENFLAREGIAVPNLPRLTWDSVPKDFLPVVWVNNGRFTAAGIAYCARELEAMTDLEDMRPRRIYMVKIEKLLRVSDDYFRRHIENQKKVAQQASA